MSGKPAIATNETPPVLELRLLGPITVHSRGEPVALPRSRKVRALLAWLAMAAAPVGRSDLCDLFWDVADDPRAELRWCLSRLRAALGKERIPARQDRIRLDLSGCRVDASLALDHGGAGPEGRVALFAGEFCEGLALDRSHAFQAWLLMQRRVFRDLHVQTLAQLVERAPPHAGRPHLERWLQLAPFDLRPHATLMAALLREGRHMEAEAHLAATERLFAAEGLDTGGLHAAWQAARTARPACRASIAVLPFEGVSGRPAQMLAHDITARLARMQGLRVIAQGTVAALQARHHTAQELGHILAIDYLLEGALQPCGNRTLVRAALTDARSAAVVWATTVAMRGADPPASTMTADRIALALDRVIRTAERGAVP